MPLVALLLSLVLAAPAAAQPAALFPPGSSFGLAPFPGAQLSDRFAGLIEPRSSASVVIAEFPPEAFDEMAAGLSNPAALAGRGITVERVERLDLGGLEALRITGRQTAQGATFPKCLVLVRGRGATGLYTAQTPTQAQGDACALIAGVAERDKPGLTEQLAALPFVLDDTAGFRPVAVVAGNTLLMTVGPEDRMDRAPAQPFAFVGASVATVPVTAATRMETSLRALQGLAGFRDLTVTARAEADRSGTPVTELLATARDDGGRSVRLAQWLHFAPNGQTIRLVAVVPINGWAAHEPALRRLATGLHPR
jgi:hypothetical protein